MNRGGNTSPAAGFTIVETLIVLAVTSTLLVSAMLAMAGRQAKTEFQVGREAVVRDLQSMLSQIESGRYESTNAFTCTREDVAWVGGIPRFDTSTSTAQGSNGQCIFIGLALNMGGTQKTYNTYLLAGSREGYGGGADVATLEDAHPQVLMSSLQARKFPNGLEYAGSRYLDADGTTYSAVTPANQPMVARLMLNLNGADALEGKLAGSQSVGVHSTVPWNFDVSFTVNGATPIVQPKKSLEICLASGGTNQSVIVTLGTAWSNKVSSQVKSGRTCGW